MDKLLGTGQIAMLAGTHLCTLAIGALGTRLIDGQRCNHHHHVEDEPNDRKQVP